MKKIILEKLLHSYKGLDPNAETPTTDYIDGQLCKSYKKANHFFAENNRLPSHITSANQDPFVLHSFYKGLSKHIQESAKFYVDLNGETLTKEEAEKIASEVIYVLPYQSTFVQFDTGDVIINMMVMEDTDTDVHELDGTITKGMYRVMMFPFNKLDNCFVYDPNIYTFKFHDDGSYTFWLDEDSTTNPFASIIDVSADATGMYTNKSLNAWAQAASELLITFFTMLHYPQITNTKSVKGVKPQHLQSRSRYKASELRGKPTWEHKTLVLDLYGNEGGSNTTSNGQRSSGTAFHSVRKHLRRLPDGKHIFVKAHFRGSKDVGVVQKDYQIRT